jgi:ATP-dependent Zn protease
VVTGTYERVTGVLRENRSVLDALAAKLEEKDVLSGEEMKAIVKKS